jgi:meso-butanediol dehydrogenase/(S,S)-butanediol dehydrogenase/diacetyl reductase
MRVVVVTGGASGIGETIVNRFASDGDRVVVADIDELRARQVADNLTAAGLPAESETVDVTSEGEVAAMFDAIIERHGRVDALVCASGIETPSAVLTCTDEEWQRALDVNLKGPFLCCKHGIPAIASSGGGAVVLIDSAFDATDRFVGAAYCVSKGALAGLAEHAASEHAADAVRVNVVSPPVDHERRAAEVAATVARICASEAPFTSGTTIAVD